jgi:hypothetical protein
LGSKPQVHKDKAGGQAKAMLEQAVDLGSEIVANAKHETHDFAAQVSDVFASRPSSEASQQIKRPKTMWVKREAEGPDRKPANVLPTSQTETWEECKNSSRIFPRETCVGMGKQQVLQ